MRRKSIYPQLEVVIREAHDKKIQLAEALNLSPSGLTTRLIGVTDFRKKEIDIILKRYGKKYEDIF